MTITRGAFSGSRDQGSQSQHTLNKANTLKQASTCFENKAGYGPRILEWEAAGPAH